MRQFPVILIPPEVQRIAQSKPVAPEFNPKLPSLPASGSPDPIDTQEALFFTGGLMFIVFLVSLAALPLAMMLLIVGTIAIVLRVRLQFQTYKKRSHKYQADLQRYLLLLESYSREEVKYQSELAIAHSPSKILGFRQQQYRNFFKKLSLDESAIGSAIAVTAINPSNIRANIHKAAYNLGIKIQPYLSGTIYQGVKLHIASIEYYWIPDLAYVDPALNLHLAIEIFPASDMRQNDLADRFLMAWGWIVIRFSEQQVLENLDYCCQEVAKLLDRLSLDTTVLPSFVNIPD
jgi:hypothetical protein